MASTNAANASFVTAKRSMANPLYLDVVRGAFPVTGIRPFRLVAHHE